MRKKLLAVLLASMFAGNAWAENKTINIAPQDMPAALHSLASQTGIQLLFAAEDLKGIQAKAISGAMSAEDALARLLEGTNYTFTASGSGTYVIKVASVENVAELPAVVVRGTTNGGYVAKRASAGTKADTPIHETPVSIQAVPREVMDDQQVINVKEATKNISSVLPSTYGFYEAYTIRGFDTGYAAAYRNGLRQPSFSDQQTANVEQVEVLKGPAAILYGRIQPGGMVNIVTKRPQAQPYYSIQQQVGSYDLYRTTVDATGPLSEDGSLLYRVNAAYQKNNSFVDFVSNKSTFAAPSLTWRPSTRFEFNLEGEYQRREYVHFGTSGGGVPAVGNRPADIPRSRYIGDPSISVANPNQQNRDFIGFDWNYAINDNWNLKHRFGYMDVDYFIQYAAADKLNETTGVLTQKYSRNMMNRASYATNLDLTGKFSTGDIHHDVLLGIDYYRMDQYGIGNVSWNPGAVNVQSINIYNPVYTGLGLYGHPGSAIDNWFMKFKENWTGIYFQDQMRFGDKWHLLAGGRFDDTSLGNGSEGAGGSLAGAATKIVMRHDNAFSPRLGLLYQPMPWLSLYGNYVESFGSNNGVSATGQAFDPQKATQYEAGIKSELLDGRLTATLALFEITKTNVLTMDPSNPRFSIPVGEARSRGVELDVTGRIDRNWSVIGNLAFDRAEITKDNRGNQGKILPGVPLRSGSIWAKYDTGSATEGFSFGAGVFLRDQRQGDTKNTFQLPGYGRVDALLAYRFKVLDGKIATAQLNVQNLLDKTYFDHGGSNDNRLNSYYGEPRSIMGSLRLEY